MIIFVKEGERVSGLLFQHFSSWVGKVLSVPVKKNRILIYTLTLMKCMIADYENVVTNFHKYTLLNP